MGGVLCLKKSNKNYDNVEYIDLKGVVKEYQ